MPMSADNVASALTGALAHRAYRKTDVKVFDQKGREYDVMSVDTHTVSGTLVLIMVQAADVEDNEVIETGEPAPHVDPTA